MGIFLTAIGVLAIYVGYVIGDGSFAIVTSNELLSSYVEISGGIMIAPRQAVAVFGVSKKKD